MKSGVNDEESDKVFLKSQEYKNQMKILDEIENSVTPITVDLNQRAGFWRRYKAMVSRNFVANYTEGWKFTATRFFTFLITGIVLGWAFYDLDNDQDGTLSRISVTFMCLSTTGFTAQM